MTIENDERPKKKNPPIEPGDRFGRWVVIDSSSNSKNGKRICTCLCDCGKRREGVSADHLKRGDSQSCGCLIREKTSLRVKTHGMHHTKEYSAWTAMVARCTNKRHRCWMDYGGRGIDVCAEWRSSFAAFFSDMGERPPGMTLERIDNDAGYRKENCRWATRVDQARNRRSAKIIEYRGKTMCLSAWADELGVGIGMLNNRFHLGWTVERAFTEPLHPPGDQSRLRIVEYQGRAMCLKHWSTELGINYITLLNRLRLGWTVERAFTEPLCHPYHGNAGLKPKS